MAYHLTPLGRTFLRSPKSAYPRLNGCESGFRFFSPGLGRWVSRDPIGEDADISLYAAMRNSPAMLLDADGSSTCSGLEGCGIVEGATTSGSGGAATPCCARFPAQNMPCPYVEPLAPRPVCNWSKWYFEKLPGDGEPCCCTPPAAVTVTRADEPISGIPPWRTMHFRGNIKHEGCYKDIQYVWVTCWRRERPAPSGTPDWIAGAICDSWMKRSYDLKLHYWWGTTITQFFVKWLSCRDRVWVTERTSADQLY